MNEELIPSAAPEPLPTNPVIALPPDPDPTPVPEPDPTPVLEVISVDELLDRLSQGKGEPEEPGESEEPGEPEESGEPVEGDPGEALADVPVADPDPVVVVVEQVAGKLIDMIASLGRIEEHTESMAENLEIIGQTIDHPALTTSFADYTVTEALLLLLLLSVFIAACARMLRGGLSWLRS